MNAHKPQSGFTLIELLVAAAIFTFVVTSVTGIFAQALELQRRASGIQKIQENALYVLESISREVRVSVIKSANTTCVPNVAPDPLATATLVIQHPVNGTITYAYIKTATGGVITRNGEAITSSDLDVSAMAFCVSGVGPDKKQARVTIPLTMQSSTGRGSARVSVSLQTTIISRDLSEDLSI